MLAWTVLACSTFPTPEVADPRAQLLIDTNDTAGGGALIDPIAVGFEFDGIIRADGSITGYNVGGYAVDPSLALIVADLDFFATGDPSLTCTFFAVPFAPPLLPCDLPNEDLVDTWNSYEATVVLTSTDCGGLLDPAVQAQLEDAFDGMRLGISFGPMTTYLEGAWDPATFATFEPAMSAMYVSLVDPDGSWVGRDWTTGISFSLDPATGQPFVNPAGSLVAVPDVSTNDATLDAAYVRTFAYWYQDFPLMDFLQLDDVDGVACDCTPDPGDTGLGGDGDGDGVCDALDPCPLDDPDDSDGDGVCESDDPCPADDPDDSDLDGVCDSDDPCPANNPDDTDGDGVCDSDDACPDDAPDDTDGDGVCDSEDPCPTDDPDDSDGDGVCESADVCPDDNPDDTDGDGSCDSDDVCPLDAPDDTDGDGVCDSYDDCPLDATDDRDQDGVCDSEDECPDDSPDDVDGDGVCGPAIGGTDTPPTTDDGGAGDGEKGCGCASPGPAGGAPILALCAALVLGRRGAGSSRRQRTRV